VAFDTGVLTVNGGLRIHLARQLADAIQTDRLARQYYGKPPLRRSYSSGRGRGSRPQVP
jgi:putative restriction endonuclease